MAKKRRRVRKPSTKNTTGSVDDIKQNLSTSEQFALEYAYVIKDLRHVLILAVIMFVLLILANLVLQ